MQNAVADGFSHDRVCNWLLIECNMRRLSDQAFGYNRNPLCGCFIERNADRRRAIEFRLSARVENVGLNKIFACNEKMARTSMCRS